MRDIRLLTLFKQHYLDYYRKPLTCQYTCLGYYDGIDIEKVENCSSRLFKKRSKAPISEILYATGMKIQKLEGGYSSQNIGIFRCVSKESQIMITQHFWNNMCRMPFLAIGFLQIADSSKYDEVGQSLESKYNNIDNEKALQSRLEKALQSRLLTYCTFDNADLVVLLQSNSIKEMDRILRELENTDEVKYFHSIIGISEEYLKDCKATNPKQILDNWKGIECFIYDDLKKISLHLVTSGSQKVLNRLRSILERWNDDWKIKGYEKAKYSYMMGHESIEITFTDTDVRSLLILVLPEGIATHQNPCYGNGLYNVATTYSIGENLWQELGKEELIKDDDSEIMWCYSLIKKYAEYLRLTMEKGDEGLASYYQALIQTLITLDQYENFKLANNMFYLLFPALDMFDRQLEEILRIRGGESHLIRDSICQFLDSMNSVIYHTIHTDQMFLMIPGYCGTSFSIPVKLSLMYLWFIDKTSEILNDSEYEYHCILVPEMESTPMTKILNVDYSDRNRLICVKFSQRTLYLPRDSMIILLHEMGHYIGNTIRNRTLRLSCIIKTLAYIITEGIFPEEYESSSFELIKKEIFDKMKESIKIELQKEIIEILEGDILLQCPSREYYAENIESILMESCLRILALDNTDIDNILHSIPQDILNKVKANQETFLDNMRYIYTLQVDLEINRGNLLVSGKLERIILELIKIYREVFSDMVAIAILNCSKEDFREAFCVSEGIVIDERNRPDEQKIREEIAKIVVFESNLSKKINIPIRTKNGQIDLLGNLYSYIWVQDYLIKYADESYENLQKMIELPEKIKQVQQLRELFVLFRGDREANCFEIFKQINNCIYSYMEKTKEQYSDRMIAIRKKAKETKEKESVFV